MAVTNVTLWREGRKVLSVKLTEAQVDALAGIARVETGTYTYSGSLTRTWQALERRGLVTVRRKAGSGGVWRNWATITEQGNEVLAALGVDPEKFRPDPWCHVSGKDWPYSVGDDMRGQTLCPGCGRYVGIRHNVYGTDLGIARHKRRATA